MRRQHKREEVRRFRVYHLGFGRRSYGPPTIAYIRICIETCRGERLTLPEILVLKDVKGNEFGWVHALQS